MPIVHVPMLYIPGTATFAAIPDAGILLKKYGWQEVSIESGLPAGKISVATKAVAVVSLNGRPGGNQTLANSDVESAFAGVGIWKYRIGNAAAPIAGAVLNAPVVIAGGIGRSVGAGLGGVVEKAGVGITGTLLVAGMVVVVAAVGVAVFVAKKA